MGISSAFAYNVGDYIYTRNGKFKVKGANLITGGVNSITTMGGTPLNPDTVKIVSEGADLEDSPNGEPFLMVTAGNIKSNCTALSEIPTKLCANFKTAVPVTSSARYVAMYKVKSLAWRTSSTQYYTGRNMNYQNIAFRPDLELDVTGITSYADWATYDVNDGWVELAYDLVPPEDGFLNFWFFNLLSGDCFGDFGVYEVIPVADDRVVRDFIDEINTYLSVIPEKEGDETRGVLIEEILPVLNGFLEDPDTNVDDVNDFILGVSGEDGPVTEFLNANSVDLSKYYTNFTFDGLSTGSTRLASGWTTDTGTDRWGLEAATGTTYDTFSTVHVYQDNSGLGTLAEGNYTQSADLPKGKYLYTLKAQAYHHFINGSGGSNDKYIPAYFEPVEGFKYFINGDSVDLNVPTRKPATFINVFDIAEDGMKTIGFHSPGNASKAALNGEGQNTTGGGRYRFDNMQLRMIGVDESYISAYFYKNAIENSLSELQESITSAEADYASATYVFGKTELNAAIDEAKTALATYTNYNEEDLASLNDAKKALSSAVSAYKKINAEYVALGNDIQICKTDLADEKWPKGKDEFGAAINVAETYYLAQTETSRDSLTLCKTDSTLMSARMYYQLANASLDTPAEIVMVNPSFAGNATGWINDGLTGTAIWKYGTNSDFTDGSCAYYNRGPAATDSKFMYQDVALPLTGVYGFSAELICRNYKMGSLEESPTEMYIFAGKKDSTEIYTLPDPNIVLDSNGQTYPGGVKRFTQIVKVSDLNDLTILEQPNTLRVGIAPTVNARTVYPNLIYIGSCRLYYYGSIADYESGISVVEKTPAMTGDIYSISGTKVRSNATSLSGLPKGIYIMNGKKYVVK